MLDPQRYVDYATGLGKSVIDTAAYWADPDRVFALAASTYDRFASIGPGEPR